LVARAACWDGPFLLLGPIGIASVAAKAMAMVKRMESFMIAFEFSE
jgi:hypothetical protein